MKKLTLALFLLCFMPSVAYAADSGLGTILNDKITMLFIVVNIILTVLFCIKFDRFAVTHGPEVLTTVGIFGCFLGIALALLHFDPQNVSTSVPHLLEGVKTAFWASMSGVGGSLIIRARHRFHREPIPQSAGASKAASLDDVVDGLRGLQNSFSGKEEGSLLTQMKLMRQEQSDQLIQLRSSFESFAEKMAENGSKALVEALREVITDFNSKIHEQFGDNFKQLNTAVEKLVVWQQQYKEELNQLQLVQQQSAQDLKQAASGMALMVHKAASFTEVATGLENLLIAMNQQQQQVEQSQTSLSAVLLKMQDVTPQFSQKIDTLVEGMTRGVSKMQADTSTLIQGFGEQVQSSHREMKQVLVESMKRSQSEINTELSKSLEVVRQGVITLDQGLQEELTKSLEGLGRQLASLSEKFVADYTPLTQRLRDVVKLAERV